MGCYGWVGGIFSNFVNFQFWQCSRVGMCDIGSYITVCKHRWPDLQTRRYPLLGLDQWEWCEGRVWHTSLMLLIPPWCNSVVSVVINHSVSGLPLGKHSHFLSAPSLGASLSLVFISELMKTLRPGGRMSYHVSSNGNNYWSHPLAWCEDYWRIWQISVRACVDDWQYVYH